MRQLKPTHLSAAVKVLTEGDFANAEEAAKAVIQTVDELRAKDLTYMAVRQYVSKVDGTAMYMAYGPYPTKNAAMKAAEEGKVGIPGYGVLAIVPVRSPEAVEAKLESINDLGKDIGANHWTRVTERVTA